MTHGLLSGAGGGRAADGDSGGVCLCGVASSLRASRRRGRLTGAPGGRARRSTTQVEISAGDRAMWRSVCGGWDCKPRGARRHVWIGAKKETVGTGWCRSVFTGDANSVTGAVLLLLLLLCWSHGIKAFFRVLSTHCV